MYEDFTPTRAPITPEFALAVLQDSHRQQCRCDPEADPSIELSFDTTVAKWRQACDLLGWRRLADAYNDWWGFQCSYEEWRTALEPAKKRTLRDVCDLLARHAKLPEIRAATLLGSPCLSCGTFLTIRSLLVEAGADARNIAPSTALEPYAQQFWAVFLGPISWLAPGTLPPVKIHHPIHNRAIWGILTGLIALFIGACASVYWLIVVGAVFFLASYAMTWVTARRLGRIRVEFGDLKTFRDLTNLLANHVRGQHVIALERRNETQPQ